MNFMKTCKGKKGKNGKENGRQWDEKLEASAVQKDIIRKAKNFTELVVNG